MFSVKKKFLEGFLEGGISYKALPFTEYDPFPMHLRQIRMDMSKSGNTPCNPVYRFCDECAQVLRMKADLEHFSRTDSSIIIVLHDLAGIFSFLTSLVS